MKIDYKNTWNFKLACRDPTITDFYLGYSTRSHEHVLNTYEQRCKNDVWHVCAFIREHGGFQNFYVERVASIECTSSMEARTELRKHFDASPPSLNKRLPTRTHAQYAQGGVPRATQKIYREANREKIREDQHRSYTNNKERIAGSRKDYYIKNGERMREKNNARRRALRASGLEAKAQANGPPAGGDERESLAETAPTTTPTPNP
jgi:hypothetical protein